MKFEDPYSINVTDRKLKAVYSSLSSLQSKKRSIETNRQPDRHSLISIVQNGHYNNIIGK